MSLIRTDATREGAEPALSALAFFFVLTSYYIIRPVRDQLSGAVGSSQLPLFYVGAGGRLTAPDAWTSWITLDDMANTLGTINYEVVTSPRGRVNRVYAGGTSR